MRAAIDAGLPARRMWGSDGRSAGYSKEVDVVIANWPFQCKRRTSVASYIKPDEHIAGQIIRGEREKPLIVLRLSDFLELLKQITHE